MKKILLSSFAIFTVIFFSSCNSNKDDPKTVLSNFFAALAKKDFTAVKKYSTDDSEGMLSMVEMGMQNISDTSETMKFNRENIELGNAVINGDRATVPVTEKNSGETTDFTLKKEDGQWKVAFDMSTLIQMIQAKMKEHGFRGIHPGMNNLSGMDSVSKEDMQRAREKLDSINKILNK